MSPLGFCLGLRTRSVSAGAPTVNPLRWSWALCETRAPNYRNATDDPVQKNNREVLQALPRTTEEGVRKEERL